MGVGTATAPIYAAHKQGYNLHVYADETRPLLQGARLTAFELQSAGVDVTLLCDNMAASLMKSGAINAVFVGADRIAANGDTANKIGTLGAAILAKRYNIPFYVCAPSSTFDRHCAFGADIPIELRAPSEVSEMWYKQPMTAAGVKIYNPSFDVTDAELITAFITDKGILTPPYISSLQA
jgi:methylthioribose-1-phosphate isomerase